jgi:anti-sigma B factor antagonist
MPLHAPSSPLRVEQADDITVVRFTTSQVLGEGPCEAVRKQLFGLVDDGGRRKLLLDLTGVERLDSDVVAKLIWLDKRVKAAGGRLALCHLTPALSAVFQTLRLHRLLSIYGDEQAAVQTLR